MFGAWCFWFGVELADWKGFGEASTEAPLDPGCFSGLQKLSNSDSSTSSAEVPARLLISGAT